MPHQIFGRNHFVLTGFCTYTEVDVFDSGLDNKAGADGAGFCAVNRIITGIDAGKVEVGTDGLFAGTVQQCILLSMDRTAKTVPLSLMHTQFYSRTLADIAAIVVAARGSIIAGGDYHIIFYGRSALLKSLYYFPYVQILVITAFIMLGFIAFRSSKHDEQNRVWIGLAKETAHQLGTPTSSLLGWIEYLRSQDVDQGAVEEMNKDLTHLMKIVDRFSKIGSETPLTPANINEVVGESVMYFRKRIPRNVTLDYNGLAIAPVQANINAALFEWVVENLMKNSLDALQGHGSIDVHISSDEKNVMIDVKDTGKGIPKSNWKRIFEPGFTTKTRGWGLGLSLSRRIVEDYHQGKIAVIESEIGKGTTIRITLKRIFEG